LPISWKKIGKDLRLNRLRYADQVCEKIMNELTHRKSAAASAVKDPKTGPHGGPVRRLVCHAGVCELSRLRPIIIVPRRSQGDFEHQK
jgi:hypothetical protein